MDSVCVCVCVCVCKCVCLCVPSQLFVTGRRPKEVQGMITPPDGWMLQENGLCNFVLHCKRGTGSDRERKEVNCSHGIELGVCVFLACACMFLNTPDPRYKTTLEAMVSNLRNLTHSLWHYIILWQPRYLYYPLTTNYTLNWPCSRSWSGSTSASWLFQSLCVQTVWKHCRHLWKQAGMHIWQPQDIYSPTLGNMHNCSWGKGHAIFMY